VAAAFALRLRQLLVAFGPAVRLTSPPAKAYPVLAPVHGRRVLADLPPQVKDPPDLAEEAQAAPRAASLGSACCEQLAAESFLY